jgi:hypothetical protein
MRGNGHGASWQATRCDRPPTPTNTALISADFGGASKECADAQLFVAVSLVEYACRPMICYPARTVEVLWYPTSALAPDAVFVSAPGVSENVQTAWVWADKVPTALQQSRVVHAERLDFFMVPVMKTKD